MFWQTREVLHFLFIRDNLMQQCRAPLTMEYLVIKHATVAPRSRLQYCWSCGSYWFTITFFLHERYIGHIYSEIRMTLFDNIKQFFSIILSVTFCTAFVYIMSAIGRRNDISLSPKKSFASYWWDKTIIVNRLSLVTRRFCSQDSFEIRYYDTVYGIANLEIVAIRSKPELIVSSNFSY